MKDIDLTKFNYTTLSEMRDSILEVIASLDKAHDEWMGARKDLETFYVAIEDEIAKKVEDAL